MPLAHSVPDYLSHYYEASVGPFRNLSDLPLEGAQQVLDQIRQKGGTFASQRGDDYMSVRLQLEWHIRQKFIAKGGAPQRQRPHYMILGSCPWVKTWYRDGRVIKISISEFEPGILSFTYGDLFPAMRYEDGQPHRKQVFILQELPLLIATYGLPQVWNSDGRLGPDRYIEAQVWGNLPHER